MKLDIEYLAILGFCVETLTEMLKKWLEFDSRYTLIFALLIGLLLATLTGTEGLKYQLDWNIPDWVGNIITGICISSFAKFYDYIFKFIKLKED
ncbi:MAG: hypothetical protein GYA14_14130 [Ignavibacteria bacterium]|nr:hypothetical protein [Ignavibacteria bacterium]